MLRHQNHNLVNLFIALLLDFHLYITKAKPSKTSTSHSINLILKVSYRRFDRKDLQTREARA